MKKYIIFIIALISLTGCLHNDGDIGPLFGRWKLKSYTVDNQTVSCDSVFISFQGNVTDIRKVLPEFQFIQNYGLYEKVNDSIFLFLSENDPSIDYFAPELYKEFHFDSNNDRFLIKSISEKKMTFEKGNRSWYFEKYYVR